MKLIRGEDILRALSERILDGDGRALRVHLDIRQARGAARRIARLRHHGKDDLSVEHDLAIGEDRVIAGARAAIVDARNISRGQDGDNSRISLDAVEVDHGYAPL